MKFCEEEIKWTELVDVFQEIYNKSCEMEDVSVLQGLAIARQLKDDVDEFLSKLQMIGLKAIICKVLESYDIDHEIEEVTTYITELFDEFNDMDISISAITKDGFATLEEVEDAVAPLFDSFITSKEDIEVLMGKQLKTLFMPLTELGASESQIDQALEDVEYSDSPTDYILEVFLNITDQTLNEIN